jgi:hypothetical protein
MFAAFLGEVGIARAGWRMQMTHDVNVRKRAGLGGGGTGDQS